MAEMPEMTVDRIIVAFFLLLLLAYGVHLWFGELARWTVDSAKEMLENVNHIYKLIRGKR